MFSFILQYEFKAKGVKKRKVTVDVSTDGVRVTSRKNKTKVKVSNFVLIRYITEKVI